MDEMKKKKNFIKRCPVFILLLVSGLLLSLAGVGGKNSIYRDYSFDVVKMPYLALVMKGIGDKVWPFEAPVYGEMAHTVLQWFQKAPEDGTEAEPLVSGGLAVSADTVQTDTAQADTAAQTEVPEPVVVSPPAETVTVPSDTATGNDAQTAPASVSENAGVVSGNDSLPVVSGNSSNGMTYDFQTVTEDYFNDAVFIGDSRTQGLFEYGGMEDRAHFYSKVSLTIYDVLTEPIVKDEETGKKITVEEALQKKQFGKVYLMLGINELGTGNTESFMEEYRKVVARIRELQPNAILFVEGIMRVTGSKNESDPIFNNTNINDKNNEIAKLANGSDIFYLDVNEVVCDAQGNLNADYTVDEVHLKAQYYSIWKEFLLNHGIVR